jgi:hypothetical protein
MGRRGPVGRIIYTKVIRVQLTEKRRGLLSFFEQLEKLPRGKRDDVLLDAIQHGAVKAQEKMAQNESAAVERAIDNILDGF